MSSTILAPFQLLELNIISAQDLSPVPRSMQAYAVAWVHPNRKLSTRIDAHGRNNPTWNDKFVFRVDEKFLRNDTSAVMIEIFALHWFRDTHVGTIRVLVGNLIPPPAKSLHQSNKSLGMRFVALQVRRRSGRPQGILNIGVALLDSSMRSMPLYTQVSSALGYRQLMGEEDPFTKNTSTVISNYQNSISFVGKPDLRRTKSDTNSMIDSEIVRRSNGQIGKKNSIISASEQSVKKNENESSKASTILSRSDMFKRSNKVAGSKLSESDVLLKDSSNKPKAGKAGIFGGFENLVSESSTKGKIGKTDSMVSGSDARDKPKKTDSPTAKINKQNGLAYGSPCKPFSSAQGHGYVSPKSLQLHKKAGKPVITQSELGPSPSEVAAAKAKEKLLKQANDEESSVVMAWEIDSSVEGLESKLERWRAELPPLYDTSFLSSSAGGGGGGGGTTARHRRRYTDDSNGPGWFSCFSNICGCECSIVCRSGSPDKKGNKKSGSSGRLLRSLSDNESSSFSRNKSAD